MKDRRNVTLTSIHIESFKKIVGESFVAVDEESLLHYSHDETETLSFLPRSCYQTTHSRRDQQHYENL